VNALSKSVKEEEQARKKDFEQELKEWRSEEKQWKRTNSGPFTYPKPQLRSDYWW
jgi:hypothetical protein